MISEDVVVVMVCYWNVQMYVQIVRNWVSCGQKKTPCIN